MSSNKKKFWTDVHEGAKNEISLMLPENPDEDTYFLGDIFDLSNCKKSDVKYYQGQINAYRQKMGQRYRLGNHERQRDRDILLHIGYGVGIMHGDEISWGAKRSMNYRSGEHGAGFFKRVMFTEAREIVEQGWERELSEEDLQRADDLMAMAGCHTVIIGHCHPRKQRVYKTPNGRKLIVLKRGLTELDITTLDQLPFTKVS